MGFFSSGFARALGFGGNYYQAPSSVGEAIYQPPPAVATAAQPVIPANTAGTSSTSGPISPEMQKALDDSKIVLAGGTLDTSAALAPASSGAYNPTTPTGTYLPTSVPAASQYTAQLMAIDPSQPDSMNYFAVDANGNVAQAQGTGFSSQQEAIAAAQKTAGWKPLGGINDGTGPFGQGRTYYINQQGIVVAEDGSTTGGYAGLNMNDPIQAAKALKGVSNTQTNINLLNAQHQASSNEMDFGGYLVMAAMGAVAATGFAAALGSLGATASETGGAIDAVGGAGTGVGEAVGSNAGIISGGEGTTSLIGGTAADTTVGSTPGLIDSLGSNLDKVFDPFNLMEKAAINTLSQAVMQDGEVDWSKVGVSTLLNAFGGALGQTAGTAVGGGLIGSVT